MEHPVRSPESRIDAVGFAWDIGVGSFDPSGRKYAAEFCLGPDGDAAWSEHLREHGDEVFNTARAEVLGWILSGEYATYPGSDHGHYHFTLSGRSGEWLVLHDIEGLPKNQHGNADISFTDAQDMENWLHSLADEELVKLYKLVVEMDYTVSRRHDEMEYQYAAQRQLFEGIDYKIPTSGRFKP